VLQGFQMTPITGTHQDVGCIGTAICLAITDCGVKAVWPLQRNFVVDHGGNISALTEDAVERKLLLLWGASGSIRSSIGFGRRGYGAS